MKMTCGRQTPAFFFAPAIVALLVATCFLSCKGGTISSGSGSSGKTDLELSFAVLGGAASTSSAKSGSRPISPLILTTASTLTVSLAPLDAGLSAPPTRSISIVDDRAVTVSFDNVEYGNYEVSAVAADAGGNAQFRQSAKLSVSSATKPTTLNLIPAAVDTITIETVQHGQNFLTPMLAPGASATYLVPVEVLSDGVSSPIPANSFEISFDYGTAASTCRVYVQSADGSLLFGGNVDTGLQITKTGGTSGESGTVVTLSATPAAAPFYLTIFNDAAVSMDWYAVINYDYGW